MTNPYWNLTPEEAARIDKAAGYEDAFLGQSDEDEEAVECTKHGVQAILEVLTFTGFAGGTCYVATLTCGCQIVDESDDVEAAR